MRGVNFGGSGEFCIILGVNSLDFCPVCVAKSVNFGGFCAENGAKIHASVAKGVNSLNFCSVFVAKFVNFKAKTMQNSAFKGREMKANAENSAFWSAL